MRVDGLMRILVRISIPFQPSVSIRESQEPYMEQRTTGFHRSLKTAMGHLCDQRIGNRVIVRGGRGTWRRGLRRSNPLLLPFRISVT